MFLDRLYGLFSNDMGIDLGTANTLVNVRGEGIVLCEPSVVAIKRGSKTPLAVGIEAKKMLGRTPADIVAIRPLKDGVIADFEITEAMLRYFIRKVHNRKTFVRPRIVVGVPSGITEVEKRAVRDSAEQAGAREVYLIEEPMAAAIGSGLPVAEPTGSMIIDIGGGTTEVAVTALGGLVVTKSVRIAGDEFDEAIVSHIKKKYNLLIGDQTAELIKMKIGSAFPLEKETSMPIKGRDLLTGLPKTLTCTSEEIREALQEPIAAIIETVKSTIERTPPELAGDILEKGLMMAGGGALLRGLDNLISSETGLPVHLTSDPLTAVVVGTGKILEDDRYLRVLSNAQDNSAY
jgi:rod shape-determining protein MreB